MTQNNYGMLCIISSNLLKASEMISDIKYERLSKSLLEDSVEKAIVLLECSLEALKRNKENLFEDNYE